MTDPFADLAPPPLKPARKARKPRASKQPAAVKAATKPRKPRRSLLAIIEAMGPHHLRAYRALSEGDKTWATALGHALGAEQRVAEAIAAEESACVALSQAKTRRETAVRNQGEGAKFLKDLDELAKQIAFKRGDVPHADDAPTDADFKGLELPI